MTRGWLFTSSFCCDATSATAHASVSPLAAILEPGRALPLHPGGSVRRGLPAVRDWTADRPGAVRAVRSGEGPPAGPAAGEVRPQDVGHAPGVVPAGAHAHEAQHLLVPVQNRSGEARGARSVSVHGASGVPVLLVASVGRWLDCGCVRAGCSFPSHYNLN